MARKKLADTLPTPSAKGKFFGTHQVAHMLGLSPTTVQSMVESGALPAWKTVGGHRRIPASALEAYTGRPEFVDRGTDSSQIRVMVAEDDVNLQRVYRTKISTWGLPLELTIVGDGLAAMMAIGQHAPDVLLADLAMPKVDGFQMIRTLRTNRGLDAMDIIVISGLDESEIQKRGGLPPGVAVLKKPVPFEQLLGFFKAKELRRQMCATPA